jgi:hypothetical protein
MRTNCELAAALEAAVRYVAAELGPKGIRVNAISAGPLATRAASGIPEFDALLEKAKAKAPARSLVSNYLNDGPISWNPKRPQSCDRGLVRSPSNDGGVQRADCYVIVHFGTSGCDGHHTDAGGRRIANPLSCDWHHSPNRRSGVECLHANRWRGPCRQSKRSGVICISQSLSCRRKIRSPRPTAQL